MQTMREHIGFVGSRKRAIMSEVLAMQCNGGLAQQPPMSRRNDAFTSIYYYRYC